MTLSGIAAVAGRRCGHGVTFAILHTGKPSIGRQSRINAARARGFTRWSCPAQNFVDKLAQMGTMGRQQLEMSTRTHPMSQSKKERHWERSFTIGLPEGICVGLTLNTLPSTHPASFVPPHIEDNPDHWIRHLLHPKEIEYGIELHGEASRNSFFMGRLAMRTALATASACYDGGVLQMAQEKQLCDVGDTILVDDTGYEGDGLKCVLGVEPCILKDEQGRPTVPSGFLGSISHKRNTGVALVAEDGLGISCSEGERRRPTKGIGVDIEQFFSRRKGIKRRILTPNELDNLGNIEGVTRDEEVLLRFSLKESVYKAMHPLINHYVGFQEAEITPNTDGTATVVLNLNSGLHERFGEITAHWRKVDGDFFLTSSSVTLRDDL